MSPRRMLSSCGSSSRDVRLMRRPTGPIRESFETFHRVADSVSFAGRRLRNLSSSNSLPSRPTLTWRKRTPGPPSSRTARATASMTGAPRSTAKPLTATSSARLIRHDGPERAGRRMRWTGIAPM